MLYATVVGVACVVIIITKQINKHKKELSEKKKVRKDKKKSI